MDGLTGQGPDFFFIRHGETDWNREGRLQGRCDVPLNAIGRDQAAGAGRILARVLAAQGRDAAALRFTASPLGRARDTMERILAALGRDPAAYATDERLAELAFGAWEGRTWGELKGENRPLVKARQQDKWVFVPPGGESYAGLLQRLRPWLDTVRDGDVVVAHGGVARALLRECAGVAAAMAPDVEITQGRVMWFRRGRVEWF